MYVCTYIGVYIYICIYVDVGIYIFMCIYIYICIYVDVGIYIFMCIYIHSERERERESASENDRTGLSRPARDKENNVGRANGEARKLCEC